MDSLIVQAISLLKIHEGFAGRVYKDSRGYWTIGYGRNIDSVGLTGKELEVLLPAPITTTQAEYLLNNDIERTIAWLSTYSWWNALTNNRKLCILDLGFNVGEAGFKQFTHMISALQIGDYKQAAAEMKNSKWAQEVGQRAQDDIMLMIKG